MLDSTWNGRMFYAYMHASSSKFKHFFHHLKTTLSRVYRIYYLVINTEVGKVVNPKCMLRYTPLCLRSYSSSKSLAVI